MADPRRRLVIAMERTCDLIDRIPWWLKSWNPLRWLGCGRGLALWSARLDERWQTGVWEKPDNSEVPNADYRELKDHQREGVSE